MEKNDINYQLLELILSKETIMDEKEKTQVIDEFSNKILEKLKIS